MIFVTNDDIDPCLLHWFFNVFTYKKKGQFATVLFSQIQTYLQASSSPSLRTDPAAYLYL